MLLDLLIVQAVLGAFDTVYHHELKEELPYRQGAQLEMRIHGARVLIYGLLFLALASFAWHGWLALVIAFLFAAEIALTLWDFVVEDQTRVLPPSERITHTVLAINGGVVCFLLGEQLLAWFASPSALSVAPLSWQAVALMFGALGAAMSGWRDLHAARRLDALHAKPATAMLGATPHAVLITGATGFIGRRLVHALLERRHRVTVLSRRAHHAWLLFNGKVDVMTPVELVRTDRTFDVIVNLAGARTLGLPWSAARKTELLNSRLAITRLLVAFIARTAAKPTVLISGSAIGYYGNRRDEPLTERDAPQPIFMSQLCREWESTALEAERHGVRVCVLRLGLVLGWGGALPMLLAPHLVGLGARIGAGTQWVSWVHLDDVVAAIAHCVRVPSARGAYNVTAPEALTQAGFNRSIAAHLRRPALLALPAAPLETLGGEMAQMVTRGQRVVPARLVAEGFRFGYPRLAGALNDTKETP